MFKYLINSTSTFLLILLSFLITSANARQIVFGSGNDTIIFSTLSYTSYGGSYQHYWVIKNGKSCETNWRWGLTICDQLITTYDYLNDEQGDIQAYTSLPTATKAERQFLHFLQTNADNLFDQPAFFMIRHEKIKSKIHFVESPGSNKVVCTKDEQIIFEVTSVDAPSGYLKTEVCYGKTAYFQLKDLDTSYQSIPAILKKNATVYDDPFLRTDAKHFVGQDSDWFVGLHPTAISGVWRVVERVVEIEDSFYITAAYDPTAIEMYSEKDKFTATYVSESEIRWLDD